MFVEEERVHSKAANTGTAAGRAIELLHQSGVADNYQAWCAAVGAALTVTGSELDQFPMADLAEVQTMVTNYATDPRNWPSPLRQTSPVPYDERGDVVGKYMELEVKLTLDPAPEDPTGQPIELVGHVDQIREQAGLLWVWDTKASKLSGLDSVYSYCWQLAGYALAATETLGREVRPGGIIRLKDYLSKRKAPHEVNGFYRSPWNIDKCREMLSMIPYIVAQYRRGIIPLYPGPHCNYCPGEAPHICGDSIDRAQLKEM